MDIFSLGFLLLILVASGGIAYVADGLGKKIGKKRISFRGLRPKHVAQIGTVAMGVGVSFLTILVIAAASRDVRDWLVRGRGLLLEQKQLKAEVEGLEKQRQADEEARGKAVQDLDDAHKGLERAKTDAQAQERDLAETRKRRDALVEDVDRLKGDVGRIGGNLRRVRLAFDRSNHDLRIAKTNLDNTKEQVAETKKNLAVANTILRSTKETLETKRRDVFTANKRADTIAKKSFKTYQESQQLASQVKDYGEQIDAQKSSLASLQAQEKVLENQRDQAQAILSQVQTDLEARQADLQKAQTEYDRLQSFSASTFRSSRTEPLTFRAGEEVARVVVPAGAGPAAAREALESLLRGAASDAETRGAKGHRSKGGTLHAADIVDRTDPKTGLVTDADALKRAVVAQIAGRPEDQVLVATSSLNAFAGEAVSLEIAVVPNPVVYHRNAMLAEARIDGSQSEEGILDQLRRFVGGPVQERAEQDRMIPRAGAASPFGAVPTVSWFSLAQDVKRAGRPVRVQAFAGEETRAADPLHLEFKVK